MLEVDVNKALGRIEIDARFTAEGGLTALFGRSGAGKTTLVNMLAGLETPDRGRIALHGRALFDAERGIDQKPERRRLGYVFQEDRLFPHMSVEANLTYGMRLVPASERRVDKDRVVELLELGSLLRRRPARLSGGERQRVAIGRALLASPELLLMDEPLASLDAARRNEVMAFIERLRDDLAIPIVYVSHAMDEVIRLADTMVVVSEGKVVATGGVEDLMSRLDLRPHTGRHEAGAVIRAEVVARDPEHDLLYLEFAGRRMSAPGLDLPMGTRIRVHIRARDVALSLTKPEGTSILNVFEGTVRAIEAADGPRADVLLDIGAPLIARITRKSLADLALAPGKTVHAMVKAVAIDRHSLGGRGAKAR